MEGKEIPIPTGDLMVTCQKCGTPYPMDMLEADEKQKAEASLYLCHKCEAEEVVSMEEPKQRFEYRLLPDKRYGVVGLSELNELGQGGWEAVAVFSDDSILIKRGYFE